MTSVSVQRIADERVDYTWNVSHAYNATPMCERIMVGQCLPNLSFNRVGAKALRQWLPLVGISAVSRCGYPPNAVSATEMDAGRYVNRSLPSHFMQDQVKLIHYSCPSHRRHNSLRYLVIARATSKRPRARRSLPWDLRKIFGVPLRDEAGRSFGPAPSIEVNSTILGKTRRTRQAMQSAHSAL